LLPLDDGKVTLSWEGAVDMKHHVMGEILICDQPIHILRQLVFEVRIEDRYARSVEKFAREGTNDKTGP
jgi:hypothetical protein